MDNLVSQALDRASMGMIIVDKELKIIVWNHWLERFTGRGRKEVLGKFLTDIAPRFKQPMYEQILKNALFHGQSRFCSSMLHKAFILPKDEQNEDASKQNLYVEPLYEEDVCYAFLQITDMTNMYDRVHKLKNLLREMEAEYNEIKSTEQMSRHLAMHDSLTGLPNRLYFNDRLAWTLSYARRNKEKVALMFLDLDGFKEVNDNYGHEAGDQLLVETAKRLSECIRSTDTIARIGGDEFCVVLSQLKDEQDASIIANKFIRVLEQPFAVGGRSARVSVSIGISLFPKDGEEPADLKRKADIAMYKTKASGKNGYHYSE